MWPSRPLPWSGPGAATLCTPGWSRRWGGSSRSRSRRWGGRSMSRSRNRRWAGRSRSRNRNRRWGGRSRIGLFGIDLEGV